MWKFRRKFSNFYWIIFIHLQICRATTTEPPYDKPQGPIFVSEPNNTVTFSNTRGVLIPCTAYGRPAPVMDWMYDSGVLVDDIPGLLQILPNNSLYFHSFDDRAQYREDIHSATYRCTASNTGGSIVSRRMRVRAVILKEYKKYNVQLSNVWVMRGGTAVFQCDVNPFFVKDYINVTRWTRGTSDIKSESRISIIPSGQLHIRDVREKDSSSTYRCIAKNILTGDEKLSSLAYLHLYDPPSSGTKPRIEHHESEVTVLENQVVELTCVSSGYPVPSYTWFKDKTRINIDNFRYSQNGGNLVIRGTDILDSAKYMCKASNERGSATAETILIIQSPLSTFIHPTSQVIDAGHSATFNCTVIGHPISNITWYLNGKLINGDNRVRIIGGTVLNITEVLRQDQGMYQCVVTNNAENSQSSAQLSLGAAHPSFMETYRESYVQVGQSVSLKCLASGNPTPTVSWMLDDESIAPDPRISIGERLTPEGDVLSHVNITNVQIEDGGEYKCIAINDVGKVRHYGRLNVYGIPHIRPMKNITATAKLPLKIRCYVSGFPIYSITWSRGGAPLPTNHWQRVQNGTLYIEKVQDYDEGEYTCTAKNRDNQGMTRSVYVAVLEPPVIDPFKFGQRKEGDRIVVSCVVSSGDLPITISWTKNDHPIPPDLGVITQKTGPYSSLLSIDDASPKHNGNYTCHASNQAATSSHVETLYVNVPPRWVTKPHDSFVVLRKSVQIDCLTAGTPQPLVTWKKAEGKFPDNYIPIEEDNFSGDRLKVLANGTLLIKDAKEDDHSYFLCHASNGVGLGLSQVVMLTVHIPARFDLSQKNYTYLKNKNATMQCEAIGDKPLSVTWSFSGRSIITDNRRIRIETVNTNRGKVSYLFITPAGREDTGFYSCNAKNHFGSGSMTLSLTVFEPPEAPSNLKVDHVTSRTIAVSWTKPYDGNSPLLYYVLQYKNLSDVWQGNIPNTTAPASFMSATITNLHPAYSYHIRVLANNSIGYGYPSREIKAKTREEAPSGPPQTVVAEAIGSQALKITWKPPLEHEKNGRILGYYIGYKETKSPSHFIYITRTVDEDFKAEYVLHNLKKFTEYTIHIKAYNAEGIGPQSQNTKVFTLEDVPSQPPQGVQATPISSQSIKVVWSPPPLYTLHGILQGYKIMFKPVRKDEDESDASTVTSTSLETLLGGLQKYTNYSIQVLAYTRKGEGVRSNAIYVQTQADVPDAPADMKALPVNKSSILVSWRSPIHTNGLLKKYTLYVKNLTNELKPKEMKMDLLASKTHYMLIGLASHHKYVFRVTASTIIGEGPPTHEVAASPDPSVPARIASFPKLLLIPWQQPVTLPCLAVGDPKPSVIWKVRGKPIVPDDRVHILSNGSLYIDAVVGTDAANYTCRAENIHGADEITAMLHIQVGSQLGSPPNPPSLFLAATTTSTIQVNWLSGSNGGSPTQGFVLSYKKEHGNWLTIQLGSQNRTYTAADLLCGTTYKFAVRAFNRLGASQDSQVVTAKTNGSSPIMPPQSMIMRFVNATSVDLDFRTWLTAGCPVRFYSVRYHVWGEESWVEVSNNIKTNTTIFTVQDLHPATWYVMTVTAHSDAGSTESTLKFATLTYTGSTITPLKVTHKKDPQFYEKFYVMIPLCASIIILTVVSVALFLYCRRRRLLLRFKEHTNLRRDITAETSLMNDLDKRMNVELDSSSSFPEDLGKRNVNLLISLHSDDNLGGTNPMWLDSSKTNSDNGSFGRSDDDGNINPYATFKEIRTVAIPERDREYKALLPPPNSAEEEEEEQDDVAREKAAAQQEAQFMTTPSEPYVPFFHSRGDGQPGSRFQPPPASTNKAAAANKPGYENQAGVILSPRKYASADQIHALFSSAPPRPQSAYSKGKPGSRGSNSSEKGSQRHSVISSVTTVSSSRDELMEAFENAKRNPPPPVVYESPHHSSSQPTDSSVTTEPGIVQFTQSPPKPDEQREASCEVPAYEQRRHRKRQPETESDATEYDHPDLYERSPPRKARGRYRGKQRGHAVSKRPLGTMQIVPRAHSRTSTTSSEEVTYAFGGMESPTSPSEGYLSYPCDSQGIYTDSEFVAQQRRAKRRGRRTPHARVKYDVCLETPGTDENKPLVMSLAQQSLTTPPEEDEAVSLLDRYYRPVDDANRNSSMSIHLREEDKGYTDDFTVV